MGFGQVATQLKRPHKTVDISVDIRVLESTQANKKMLSGVTVMGYFARYLERLNSSWTPGRPQAGCCILLTCLLWAFTDTHCSRRKRRLLCGAYSLTNSTCTTPSVPVYQTSLSAPPRLELNG